MSDFERIMSITSVVFTESRHVTFFYRDGHVDVLSVADPCAEVWETRPDVAYITEDEMDALYNEYAFLALVGWCQQMTEIDWLNEPYAGDNLIHREVFLMNIPTELKHDR